MNRFLISAVVACGLLLTGSPEAAAHERHNGKYRLYLQDDHGRRSFSRDRYRVNGLNYRVSHRAHRAHNWRTNRMPHWLKRDRSFRRWYAHTRLRRDYRLSWVELYDAYCWEYDYRRFRR